MSNYQTLSTFFNRDTNLTRLVNAIWDSLNPSYIQELWLTNFYNIDTATGYWLDCWGTIVALPRGIKVPSEDWFGFYNSPFKPFNTYPFWDGSPEQNTVMMDDDTYRQAIKAKALANRLGRSVDDMIAILAVINTTAVVRDNRDMTMLLTVTSIPPEFRLLVYTDALRLRPAAVGYNLVLNTAINIPNDVYLYPESPDFIPLRGQRVGSGYGGMWRNYAIGDGVTYYSELITDVVSPPLSSPPAEVILTAAEWGLDPTAILEYFQRGIESDTGEWKQGDGVTAWNALSYQAMNFV